MRLQALLMSAVLLPGLAVAMPPDMQHKITTLSKEADVIAGDLVHWEDVQASLLRQKAEIEATQKDIAQQQDALNARASQHNQQVSDQKQRIQAGGCKHKDDDSEVASGDLDTVECDKHAKQLNAQSEDINSQITDLQVQQDTLHARYLKANQDASDWNAHESQVTGELNKVYQSMNDWLDKAYPVIVDGTFRDEVTARGADSVCANRGLPPDMSISTAKRLNDSYRRCLKTMLQAGRDAPKAALAAGKP